MSTPSIQTLITQAQQVLNLKSSNEIRATLAAVLANANVGTPLNPNLTTQQLWDEFYEIVRQPSDDIMSIITDQMMRMVFSPPAPGGAGADKQVIFNDGGVLAGDTKFLWDKNANRLDVDGPVVITGDLTVDTNVLKVDSTLNKVGIGVATLTGLSTLNVAGDIALTSDLVVKNSGGTVQGYIFGSSGLNYRVVASNPHVWQEGGTDLMRLNSTGLGVGGIVTGTGPTILVEGTAGTYAKFNSKVGAKTWSAGYRSGTLQYEIQEDATERFVIANGGNVGIGITPSAWATATTIWRALDLQYSCGIASSGAGSGEIDFLWNAYYDQTDQRWEFKYTGDRASRYAIGGAGVHTWYNTASTGTANLPITWVPAMTLDASGNLLVGKTGNNGTIGAGTINEPSGPIWSTLTASTSAGNTLLVYSTGAAAYRFYVGLGGTVNATNPVISAISDARLKENVQDIDVGLAAILSLKPRKFDWKTGKGKDIKGDRGFIAQEFETVFPNLIDEWKDEAPEGEAPYKSVRQDLIPVLVKAIQELTARVQTLEAK